MEVKFVSVQGLLPADPLHDRGRRTWEWKFTGGTQVTVMKRRAGEVFGGHFHKGDDPSKNPERILLLSGSMNLQFKNLPEESWREHPVDASEHPQEIEIFPYMIHRITAVTDVLYIEYRITHFDKTRPDTYPESEFS